jgi:hypothetical protein
MPKSLNKDGLYELWRLTLEALTSCENSSAMQIQVLLSRRYIAAIVMQYRLPN